MCLPCLADVDRIVTMHPMNANRKYILLFLALLTLATKSHAQPDLFNHLLWDARGNRPNQLWGMSGLSYLGYLDSANQHAVAIGEITGSFTGDVRKGVAALCYNNGKGDTARHYEFPGTQVVRGSINGDAYPDFVCWDHRSKRIVVLFGTSNPILFDTAVIIQSNIDGNLLLTRCDSDQYDDIVISDNSYEDSGFHQVGHLVFFRGGVVMQSTPTLEVYGHVGQNLFGQPLAGNIVSKEVKHLLFYRADDPTSKSQQLFLFRLGMPEFNFIPSDTLTLDTHNGGSVNGIALIHAFGDSVEDIALGTETAILIYRGGVNISSLPSFILHRPFETNSAQFGQYLVDLGDITNRGYPSLLVTDPDASLGGAENGAIFLFNMGKALKDSCVGFARGKEFEGMFGTTAIALGDINNDKRCDFMVGGDEANATGHSGYLAVFLGDSSYGPTTAVREIGITPTEISLAQNYPNPCAASTMITFDIAGDRAVQLDIYDAVGRHVATPVSGHLNTGRYAVNLNTEQFSTGAYRYEVIDGHSHISKIMSVIK